VKTRLLHIINSLQIGGLENGLINIINNLDRDKYENIICCIDSSGPMERKLEYPVKIYSFNKGAKRDYLLPFKMARCIKSIKPDIVHTRNWAAIDGVIGAKISGVKAIIHGEHGREASDPQGTNFLRNKTRKFLSPYIKRFITVSSELKYWLVYKIGIPEEKVVQIINGVDIEKYKPISVKNTLKYKLGFNHNSFIVGTVGRLDPVKDYKTLLSAFRKFIKKYNEKNSFLFIVGEGKDRKRLEVMSEELGLSKNVIFFGQRDDVNDLYNCMDIFVLPSIAEGISNTILEAMSSGLPVIATNIGGNPELVDNGKTGYLFECGDYNSLCEKILAYFKYHEMKIEHGNSGRRRVEMEFSLKEMVKKYEMIYESVKYIN
jgi:sugar transferase (PEP-CTERM/EpsH1 system associated)